jgi:two-component system, OmpR family, phosphate regulon sensor histidine kinase PhoR
VALRWSRSLRELTRISQRLVDGQYQGQMFRRSSGVFSPLRHAMSHIADRLSKKRAQQAGERSQLDVIFSGMSEGVIVVGVDDHVQFCNDSACQLLETTADRIIGHSLWAFARAASLMTLLARVRQEKRGANCEVALRQGGLDRLFMAHAGLYAGGGEKGAVFVLHDVTDLKKLERVRKDFVSNVSHELKTPLTAIQGYVETLLDGALEDPKHAKKFLSSIAQRAQHLSGIIQGLLMLAKVEAGEANVVATRVDWRVTLEDVLQNVAEAIEKKALVLVQEFDDGAYMVNADRNALTIIGRNLLDNAIRFSPTGRPVTVSLRRHDGACHLTVRDEGPGIPRFEQDRIFERFYQVDKARSGHENGSGLGLSIVKHLVQSLGGTVVVSSTEGEGSAFAVALPIVE